MILDNHVEEAQHLLLRSVDHQVLTLGNIELQQQLLLNALYLGDVFHLITELAYVDFLYRDGHDSTSDHVVSI